MTNFVATELIRAGFRVTIIGNDVYVGLDRKVSKIEVETVLEQILDGQQFKQFSLETVGREVRIFNI